VRERELGELVDVMSMFAEPLHYKPFSSSSSECATKKQTNVQHIVYFSTSVSNTVFYQKMPVMALFRASVETWNCKISSWDGENVHGKN
jgi:hypothetical protein